MVYSVRDYRHYKHSSVSEVIPLLHFIYILYTTFCHTLIKWPKADAQHIVTTVCQ